MNLLGHTYIAFKVIGKIDEYVAAGAHVNDINPFVPDCVFEYEEIHEGGPQLLKFLDEKYPERRGLALASMTHSYKYGADGFNKEIVKRLLNDNGEFAARLANKISEFSGIQLELAKGGRVHNYLWCGLDLYIMKTFPDVAADMSKSFQKVGIKETADILAECFSKNENDVERDLCILFDPIKKLGDKCFLTTVGFTEFWAVFLAGLPEKDKVNVTNTVGLLEEIYEEHSDKWQGILDDVVGKVESNMKPYI